MKREKSMVECVEKLQHYWNTYSSQPDYENYVLKTFLEDALYGIGISLSDDYAHAEGFNQFKRDLALYLAK